jgi:hypothetical protein
MKKFFLIFFALLFLAFQVSASNKEDAKLEIQTKSSGNADTVKVGIYVNDISQFRIKDNSFQVDLFVWFIWENKKIKPYDTFALISGDINHQEMYGIIKHKNHTYALKRIKATIRQNFDYSRFPLDSHKLYFGFEDNILPIESLRYVADEENTIYRDSINIPGYTLLQGKISSVPEVYKTNWGDTNLATSGNSAESVYSRLTYTLDIKRHGSGIFFKIFIGFFISIFIALASLAVRPDYGARFSLTIGAIFAAVMNITMVKSYIPDSNSWTLADMIGIITLFTVFVIIAVSCYSLKLYDEKKLEKMAKVDKVSFVVLLLMYSAVVTYLSM